MLIQHENNGLSPHGKFRSRCRCLVLPTNSECAALHMSNSSDESGAQLSFCGVGTPKELVLFRKKKYASFLLLRFPHPVLLSPPGNQGILLLAKNPRKLSSAPGVEILKQED